ncbi:hypothetical protein ZEAMMB73_Zm00001d012184 [Zea mays]|uniref:C2H2-type domain-containing protein n=1 Tax=Zea mays TaxID=4577 RepID=A0A1D6G7A8_MAIZE|nr:hypothetical protein ZEAMMB73_Zm00001d012184 [Zea mays]
MVAMGQVGAPLPSPTPSSESDDTISDHRGASSGAVVVVDSPAPAREYICKLCGMTYSTQQALGGHVAGHRNKQRAAAASTGMMQNGGGDSLAALRRGSNAQATYVCQECRMEFTTGTALGGHKRKHYDGPPIMRKNNKRPCQPLPVTLALFPTKTEEPSPPAPPMANNFSEVDGASKLDLRLTLAMPLGQAPSEEQEEQGSSSTGEQQHK